MIYSKIGGAYALGHVTWWYRITSLIQLATSEHLKDYKEQKLAPCEQLLVLPEKFHRFSCSNCSGFCRPII